jgi:hypothetical protein
LVKRLTRAKAFVVNVFGFDALLFGPLQAGGVCSVAENGRHLGV